MMDTEKAPLMGGTEPSPAPLYYDKTDTPTIRRLIILLTALVVLLSVTVMGLCVYRSTNQDSVLYILPGVALLTFSQLHIVVLYWLRRNIIPQECHWFLYMVGFSVLLEAILTIIMTFDV